MGPMRQAMACWYISATRRAHEDDAVPAGLDIVAGRPMT